MPLLQVEDVTKNYGGQVPVEVLKKINFTVEVGEFVAIMGPSGSGKTTLLNCLGTLDTVTSGKILLNGRDPKDYDKKQLADFRRKKLGFVFQNYNLLAPLTVAENIMLPLTLDGGNLDEMKKSCEKIMQDLNISPLAHKRVDELSGGECQRVAIARALIHQPELILADEPTGNLDSKAANDVLEILNQANREKKVTTLMVTHDPISASFASRVIFIKDGQLYNEIYFGESKTQFYQEILTVLSHLGGRHYDFSPTHLA